ncbi:MAG: methionyl-tRNA formyltransferase [Chloroflexota bacterium]
MPVRIIYMGTPEFAVPPLKALLAPPETLSGQWEVAAVVTQPDRPSGRGRKMTASPVKTAALAAGVEVLQPKSLKIQEAAAELAERRPDLIVVAAFGQLLPKSVLTLPPFGCINIHASLLPRWRGAAPVAAAIRAGEAETGVTLMLMDEGLDTGPMLARRAAPIRADHSRDALSAELAGVGAALLLETLPAWLAGEIEPEAQDDRLATLAPRLKKEEGAIDWTQAALEIARQVRAFYPWPGTFTEGPRGQFKILTVEPALDVADSEQRPPGTVFKYQRGVYVTTGQGALRLVTVQPAGKTGMPAEAMLNGQPELWGAQLQRSRPNL